MITVDEYENFDAVGLATLIADKKVSALEVVESAIARIESRNSTLNAVVATLFDDARAAVGQGLPGGPLSGVPYLVKDLNTWIEGVPATNGSRAFREHVPEHR